MSDLRSAASRATLLDNLYAAAETLLQAVADPLILDDAPLNHRVQALDAIGRFIDRIEKREAVVRQAQQSRPEEKVWDPNEPIGELVIAETTQEEIDCHVALELDWPGRFANVEGVLERIEYLEQNDPEALQRFDKGLAHQWFRHRRPGWFTAHIWPDGDPHPSTLPDTEHTAHGWIPAPRVDPGLVRSQIEPLSHHSARGSSFTE